MNIEFSVLTDDERFTLIHIVEANEVTDLKK